jgi:hypothetical protein
MLDSHPEMAVPDETHFLASIGRKHRRRRRPDGFDVGAFVKEIFNYRSFREWGLPEERVTEAFRASPPRNYPEAIRRLYATYAAQRGKCRYGDKTPDYVLHLDYLGRLFPDARFVHLIRDGRDIALSYMQLGFSLETAATYYWKRYVRAGRRAGAGLGPGRYREIRYEDLLADPEGQLRAMCPFLGLEFDFAMLRYFERADEVLGSVPVTRRRWHRHLDRPPTLGLRDWRREMSTEQVVLFEALAGDLLQELGYERGCPEVPLRAQLHARRRWLAVQTARTSAKARKVAGLPVPRPQTWAQPKRRS